jgi:ABC-type sugar transport system ATPase subunit
MAQGWNCSTRSRPGSASRCCSSRTICAWQICDDVAVMQQGRIVEQARRRESRQIRK